MKSILHSLPDRQTSQPVHGQRPLAGSFVSDRVVQEVPEGILAQNADRYLGGRAGEGLRGPLHEFGEGVKEGCLHLVLVECLCPAYSGGQNSEQQGAPGSGCDQKRHVSFPNTLRSTGLGIRMFVTSPNSICPGLSRFCPVTLTSRSSRGRHRSVVSAPTYEGTFGAARRETYLTVALHSIFERRFRTDVTWR